MKNRNSRLGAVVAAFTALSVLFLATPRKAEANPALLLIVALGAFVAQTEMHIILDQEIARDFDNNLVASRKSFDNSQWPYRVSDDRQKNSSYAFQSREDALAFMKKWAAERAKKGPDAAPPAF